MNTSGGGAMSVEVANEARRRGCAACTWFAQFGEAELGSCRVSPPRTSSVVQWPQVGLDDYCGCWTMRVGVVR